MDLLLNVKIIVMEGSNERRRMKLLVRLERLLEGPMILLGFVWLVVLVIELIWGLTPVLETISITIWIIFIIDFLIKFMVSPHKVRFLKTNWLTAISLVVPALRVFRMFRFFRVMRSLRGLRGLRSLRLVRLITSFNRSLKSLGATMQKRAFGYVLVLVLIVTFGGAAGMFAFETGSPGFSSYWTSLWWTAMRVITAGTKEDPLTGEGRILAILISIFGFAIFGYVTATIATFFIGRDEEEKQKEKQDDVELAALRSQLQELLDRMKKG
jgi:voltage-gated potassium channel